MDKKKIAFLIVSHKVSGAERQFAEIVLNSQRYPSAYDLSIIGSNELLESYIEANLPIEKTTFFSYKASKLRYIKHLTNAVKINKILSENDFDILHIVLPIFTVIPFWYLYKLLNAFNRKHIKFIANATNCIIPYVFKDKDKYPELIKELKPVELFFSRVKCDGVFSWYESYAELSRESKFFRGKPIVTSTKYCFTDISRFKNKKTKKNIVVYAGRFAPIKRPILFLEAINVLLNEHSERFNGWSFHMYGEGELETDVKTYIYKQRLENRITLDYVSDMAPVFSESKVFVSTQNLENFTSLSMLEAMAAGNVIIASNVGQTSEFLRDGKNGFFFSNERPESLAKTINYVLQLPPEKLEKMSRHSIFLSEKIHTFENFFMELTGFWDKVLNVE